MNTTARALAAVTPEISTKYDNGYYIYWRDACIDHYNADYFDEKPSGFEALQRLIGICRHVESLGLPVNSTTTLHFDEWFMALTPGDPLVAILYTLAGDWSANYPASKLAFVGGGVRNYKVRVWDTYTKEWQYIEWEPTDDELYNLSGEWQYHGRKRQGWESAQLTRNGCTSGSSLSSVLHWFNLHGLTLEHLQKVPNLYQIEGR